MLTKKYLKAACFFFFLFCSFICQAERDSIFIKNHKNQIIISAYHATHLAALDYHDENRDDLLTYLPNISSEIGLGIAWNWFAVSTKVYGFRPRSKYGNTKSFDFQSHWFFPKVQLSLSVQDYKGFYAEDEINNAIIIRPDLKIKLYRVYGQYILNHKKFSYRAAFSYDEQQLRSVGSFKLGIGGYYSSVSCDSSLLLNSTEKHPLREEDYQITPNLGYAYNFIFGKKKQWFSNISITAGLGVSVKNNYNKVKLFPTFYPRLAFGYGGKDWTAGFYAHFLQSQVSKMEGFSTSLNSGLFQFTCTYRFPFDLKNHLKKK